MTRWMRSSLGATTAMTISMRRLIDGTLEPVETAGLKVAKHCWVDNGINGLCVGLRGQQKAGYSCLVELTCLCIVGVGTNQCCEFPADIRGGAYESLGGCIAVVDFIAALAKRLAYVALATADTSGYPYLHGSMDSMR